MSRVVGHLQHGSGLGQLQLEVDHRSQVRLQLLDLLGAQRYLGARLQVVVGSQKEDAEVNLPLTTYHLHVLLATHYSVPYYSQLATYTYYLLLTTYF